MKTIAFLFFMSALISCNPGNKSKSTESPNLTSETEMIPDTIVQFLLTSASLDFRNHQPPTPIDFRNVKIGYIKSSDNKKLYVLCGEFLSKEKKEWMDFTTIKTSGYEQYLGKIKYCEDASMVLKDEKLSLNLKNRMTQ